jgi:Fe-S-cluster containining protein
LTEKTFKEIASLYAAMQSAYEDVRARVGLDCEGCAENCCTQRFYHYTLAEYLYLLEGIKKLSPDKRDLIFRRARVVTESYAHELAAGEIFKLMCPLNFQGLCALYEWRPMICRLHGVPHYFKMPDGTEKTGGGCYKVNEALLAEDKPRLDRTPFYTALAAIEKALREEVNFRQKIKKTTAQMLVDMAFELEMEDV